jgi:hypothetical protein
MPGLPGRSSSSRVRIGVSLPPSVTHAPDAMDALLVSVRPQQPERRRIRLVVAAALLGVIGPAAFFLSRGVASPTPAAASAAAIAPLPTAPAPDPPPVARPTPPPAPSFSSAEVSSATAEVAPRRAPRSAPVYVPRHAPAPKPAPPPPAVAPSPAPAPAAAPTKREVDCSSPYFIDDQGIKRIRTECL